jgi:hypothetical protein
LQNWNAPFGGAAELRYQTIPNLGLSLVNFYKFDAVLVLRAYKCGDECTCECT